MRCPLGRPAENSWPVVLGACHGDVRKRLSLCHGDREGVHSTTWRGLRRNNHAAVQGRLAAHWRNGLALLQPLPRPCRNHHEHDLWRRVRVSTRGLGSITPVSSGTTSGRHWALLWPIRASMPLRTARTGARGRWALLFPLRYDRRGPGHGDPGQAGEQA